MQERQQRSGLQTNCLKAKALYNFEKVLWMLNAAVLSNRDKRWLVGELKTLQCTCPEK